jgi:hypothetical protein
VTTETKTAEDGPIRTESLGRMTTRRKRKTSLQVSFDMFSGPPTYIFPVPIFYM